MGTLQSDSPASLHYLHLTSASPERLVGFYEQTLDMRAEHTGPDAWQLRGPSRRALISEGPPASVAAIGFALRDGAALARLRARIAAGGGRTAAAVSPFFRDGAFAIRDPQQRELVFGLPQTDEHAAGGAPGRLQHVVFQTTLLEENVRFYTEVLGFSVSDDVLSDDGQRMVCFLRADDEHHAVAFFRGSRNEWDHHCYETADWNGIRDWGDRFAKRRVPIFFGPGRHGPGNNLFFMVNDPDGNRLEFSAELQRVDIDHMPGVWPHDEYTLNSWGRAWIRT